MKLFLIKTLFIGFSGGTGYENVALLELQKQNLVAEGIGVFIITGCFSCM
jgi:hypothetical protein